MPQLPSLLLGTEMPPKGQEHLIQVLTCGQHLNVARGKESRVFNGQAQEGTTCESKTVLVYGNSWNHLKKQNLKGFGFCFLLVTVAAVCVCVVCFVCLTAHMQRSENNLSPSTMCVLGIRIRLPNLAVTALTTEPSHQLQPEGHNVTFKPQSLPAESIVCIAGRHLVPYRLCQQRRWVEGIG